MYNIRNTANEPNILATPKDLQKLIYYICPRTLHLILNTSNNPRRYPEQSSGKQAYVTITINYIGDTE